MSAPFRQLKFSELPEMPRVPHPFFSLPEHTVTVDSPHFGKLDVHYRTAGSGPPLALIHGLMTASYSWRYVVDALGEHFTLYIPDLPGSGKTGKPDVSYGPDETAALVGDWLREVGIEGCRVIGNSMGGYLCMRLALLRPDAMERLVNLHSPGVPLARLYALRTVLSVPGSLTLLRWLVHRDPQWWVHKNVHYYDETLKSLEEAREYAGPLSDREGVNAFGRILRETLDPSKMRAFQHELCRRRDAGEGFPIPLMLMFAEQDPMVPPWIGERFAEAVPDAQFVRLQQASHFAHVDAPGRFLPPVLEFLE